MLKWVEEIMDVDEKKAAESRAELDKFDRA